MVTASDLTQVAVLNAELNTIGQALAMIDAGDSRISAVTWQGEVDFPPPPGDTETPTRQMVRQVTVSTRDMTYPQQMVDAIKQFLQTRQQQIRDELTALGVTEAAAPAAAPPPTAPKRGARK